MNFELPSQNDEQLAGRLGSEPLGERAYSKLRWRCRRGLLENDLFIEKFFDRYGVNLTVAHAKGMYQLMDLADNDLLDLLLRRKQPEGDMNTEDVRVVLNLLVP
jgi:antitoxin CptB